MASSSSTPISRLPGFRLIEQRLDGPTWIVRNDGGQVRSFVFARKSLPCTFKRTAIYELRGDLTKPSAAVEVCEIQEVKNSGDTAYTSLAPLTPDRCLLAWYSSPVDQERRRWHQCEHLVNGRMVYRSRPDGHGWLGTTVRVQRLAVVSETSRSCKYRATDAVVEVRA